MGNIPFLCEFVGRCRKWWRKRRGGRRVYIRAEMVQVGEQRAIQWAVFMGGRRRIPVSDIKIVDYSNNHYN